MKQPRVCQRYTGVIPPLFLGNFRVVSELYRGFTCVLPAFNRRLIIAGQSWSREGGESW